MAGATEQALRYFLRKWLSQEAFALSEIVKGNEDAPRDVLRLVDRQIGEIYDIVTAMNEEESAFHKVFAKALTDCASVYCHHRKEKGDSWQQETPGWLRERLSEEISEYEGTTPGSEQEYHELIDVINVALMLLEQMGNKVSVLI